MSAINDALRSPELTALNPGPSSSGYDNSIIVLADSTAGDDTGVIDLGGSIEAAAPGGNTSEPASTDVAGASPGGSENSGGGSTVDSSGYGAGASGPAGSLNGPGVMQNSTFAKYNSQVAAQMQFTLGDLSAVMDVGLAALATARAAYTGNPIDIAIATSAAIAAMVASGGAALAALGHAGHDISLAQGAVPAAAQQAGYSLSVLGLWGTAATVNVQTATLDAPIGQDQFGNFYTMAIPLNPWGNGDGQVHVVATSFQTDYSTPTWQVGNGPQ